MPSNAARLAMVVVPGVAISCSGSGAAAAG